ncbi:uncharacterized protein LOC132387614 [Hypanus sabinus]|uniref:uncharacterized protein LOC132387614 n=1 Tax=Hypanus sabinus TaxID=79690 RepID=UPI0028C4DAE3|nr:uncharacterized protein LOC132387614 [Hypanus sabinus]
MVALSIAPYPGLEGETGDGVALSVGVVDLLHKTPPSYGRGRIRSIASDSFQEATNISLYYSQSNLSTNIVFVTEPRVWEQLDGRKQMVMMGGCLLESRPVPPGAPRAVQQSSGPALSQCNRPGFTQTRRDQTPLTPARVGEPPTTAAFGSAHAFIRMFSAAPPAVGGTHGHQWSEVHTAPPVLGGVWDNGEANHKRDKVCTCRKSSSAQTKGWWNSVDPAASIEKGRQSTFPAEPSFKIEMEWGKYLNKIGAGEKMPAGMVTG